MVAQLKQQEERYTWFVTCVCVTTSTGKVLFFPLMVCYNNVHGSLINFTSPTVIALLDTVYGPSLFCDYIGYNKPFQMPAKRN